LCVVDLITVSNVILVAVEMTDSYVCDTIPTGAKTYEVKSSGPCIRTGCLPLMFPYLTQ
jgi:hypothetical protein